MRSESKMKGYDWMERCENLQDGKYYVVNREGYCSVKTTAMKKRIIILFLYGVIDPYTPYLTFCEKKVV